MKKVTVHAGDTLAAIAQRNHVGLAALEKANPQIKNPNLIYVGETVRIPDTFEGHTKKKAHASKPKPASQGQETPASKAGHAAKSSKHAQAKGPSFTVATVNDDFNTPRSNLPHMHTDVVLAQETKFEKSRNLLSKKTYGVHQNAHRQDQAGTTVAWDHSKFHKVDSGYKLGVQGGDLLKRWINYTDVTIDGRKVRLVSVHRPPFRDRQLWPAFDRNLRAFVKSTKTPIIIGMDANQQNPQQLAHLTGLKWIAPDKHSIDGFLVSPGITADHIHRLPKATSDHHPVVATFHLGKKKKA